MVALSGLNTASMLLQQIVSNGTGSSAQPQTATSSIAQTASGVSTATGSAAKSVSSAIFNAVAVTSEKQDKAIKAVLEFIDRDYMNVEKKDASILKMYANVPSVQEAYANHKAAGERLKQQVLSDPAGTYKLLEQIKAGRPEISQEHAIGLMIAELGNRNARAGNVTVVQPVDTDPAEGAMDVVARIQSELRSYQHSLYDKADAGRLAEYEQDPMAQVMRSLAEGKDITEAMAQAEINREKGIELSESAKLSGHTRQVLDGISGRIKSLTDKLSQFATIEGNILVQKGDGTYDLGIFKIRDKSGTVNFSADADGQVRYVSPRYNDSYYGRFG